MKTIVIISFYLLSVSFLSICKSQPVAYNEALRVATNELTHERGLYNVQIDTSFVITGPDGDTLMYEFLTEDRRTLLVSANKSCPPILAIFENGRNGSISVNRDELPCGFKMLLDSYSEYLDYVAHHNVCDNEMQNRWNTYLSDAGTRPSRNNSFLNSKWGEKRSNDGIDSNAYNYLSPMIGDCKCPAGCAAVAMGQILKYWEYPFFMTARSSVIDWCNIPDVLETSNPCYEMHKRNIGKLLYECGTSANTVYGCAHSTAQIENVLNALVNNFFFSNNAYPQNMDFTVAGPIPDPEMSPWSFAEAIIAGEIASGRPFILCGIDDDEYHYFVCDGFDRGLMHINWGNGGQNNGDFSPVSILQGNGYNLIGNDFVAILSIEPRTSLLSNTERLYLSDFYNHYLPVLSGFNPYSVVPTISDTLYSAREDDPVAWRTVPSNSHSLYQAHEEVVLQPGFVAEYGCDFTARIEPCLVCDPVMTTLYDNNNQGMAENVNNFLNEKVGMSEQNHPLIKIFPNPTSSTIKLQSSDIISNIEIFDINGFPVTGWFVSYNSSTEVDIDLNALNPGVYLIRTNAVDGSTQVGRFVKQ